MNNKLPIVVLPSRWKWGLLALLSAAVFAGFVYALANFDMEGKMTASAHSGLWNALPVEGRRLVFYFATAAVGYGMILAGYNCIVAPP